MLISQLGFKKQIVDHTLALLLDEFFSTNEQVELAGFNAAMSAKFNALFNLLFENKNESDESLYD